MNIKKYSIKKINRICEKLTNIFSFKKSFRF